MRVRFDVLVHSPEWHAKLFKVYDLPFPPQVGDALTLLPGLVAEVDGRLSHDLASRQPVIYCRATARVEDGKREEIVADLRTDGWVWEH